MDLIFGSLVLIVISPILLVIAILIRLDSSGPVFFVQKRVGARRVKCADTYEWQPATFNFYKFRTMIHNADPAIHQAYVQAFIQNDQAKMDSIQGDTNGIRKLVQDPRITRIGRFLRRTSLDELPQFWNVVLGNMSLVGPRPAIPYEVDVYNSWQALRLGAQPGITGLQQITNRCTADFNDQVILDIRYIDHQSFWLDLKIILKTPFVMFFHRGAL
jgi:lipopolysaccharide/colanic/teichoic acid biosynthesis glycosyltransferase